MRDKTYDGWTDWRTLWERNSGCKLWGSRLSDFYETLAEHWWISNPKPHGWNVEIKARYAKGFKR